MFANNSLGFCVLVGKTPVAAATLAFICEAGIEIQVNTHVNFRKLGYGKLASKALITECLANNILLHWDTDNSIAKKLALSLGYTPLKSYPSLSIRALSSVDE